jgi:ribosomal-protein-serine acetyltransferase
MQMNPILVELPMPIQTPRLLLRPLRPGDGTELNAALLESLAELKPWMPFAQSAPTLADSEENVRRSCAQWALREDLRVGAFERQSGRMVANSGLHRMKWQVPSFEIGYWVRTSYAGRGYVTECVHALTLYAFRQLGARRVEIRCDPENSRSVAVIERLGFELEGRLRNDSIAADGARLRDTAVYSRLGPDGLPPLEVSWYPAGPFRPGSGPALHRSTAPASDPRPRFPPRAVRGPGGHPPRS